MKSQANRDYKSNDIVMTPEWLAKALINHFKPTGKILEPCKGNGAFSNNMICDWCEITEGKDFFEYNTKVDWIITNPPWSKIRSFLQHSMKVSDNICFLFTINHLWTKARLRDIKQSGFNIKEICLFDTPKEFPQMGFQIGMVYLKRENQGMIKLTELIKE